MAGRDDRHGEAVMARAKPDMLLPVLVEELPIRFVLQPDGTLREKVCHAVELGCVKVIAGPERCHVVVDVKRPYFRALPRHEIIEQEGA